MREKQFDKLFDNSDLTFHRVMSTSTKHVAEEIEIAGFRWRKR